MPTPRLAPIQPSESYRFLGRTELPNYFLVACRGVLYRKKKSSAFAVLGKPSRRPSQDYCSVPCGFTETSSYPTSFVPSSATLAFSLGLCDRRRALSCHVDPTLNEGTAFGHLPSSRLEQSLNGGSRADCGRSGWEVSR